MEIIVYRPLSRSPFHVYDSQRQWFFSHGHWDWNKCIICSMKIVTSFWKFVALYISCSRARFSGPGRWYILIRMTANISTVIIRNKVWHGIAVTEESDSNWPPSLVLLHTSYLHHASYASFPSELSGKDMFVVWKRRRSPWPFPFSPNLGRFFKTFPAKVRQSIPVKQDSLSQLCLLALQHTT